MSRCACGTGTCSCIIKAAPDGAITVVGNGSPTRPYVIGVPGGNPLLNLDVVDDPTLNLTISGAGTATDKRKITGQATQSLTGLKDVRAGQPLVEGDIPVWRTNHWEFEPAAAAGLPLSGVWGTPPLDGLYGTVSTIGREIYLDSAGQMRARPDVIELGPGVDLNTVTKTGKWTQSQSAEAVGNNYPVPIAGLLEVTAVYTSNAMVWQRYTTYGTPNSPGGTVFIRGLYLTTWQPWKQIGGFFSDTKVFTAQYTPGASQGDITGMAVTVPVVRTESKYKVTMTLDVQIFTAGTSTFIGTLLVPGAGTLAQLVWVPTSAVLAGGRLVMSQVYLLSGLTAGNTVFKAQASGVTFRVNANHSVLAVEQIA